MALPIYGVIPKRGILYSIAKDKLIARIARKTAEVGVRNRSILHVEGNFRTIRAAHRGVGTSQ